MRIVNENAQYETKGHGRMVGTPVSYLGLFIGDRKED
jgi:hypothetical protein